MKHRHALPEATAAVALVFALGATTLGACSDAPPSGAPEGSAVSAEGGGPEGSAADAQSARECAPAVMTLDRPGTPLCPIAKPDQPDALDAALALAGTDRCALSYSALDPYNQNQDRFRLPWWNAVHDHAMRAPGFARRLVNELDAASASKRPVTGALEVASFGLGGSVAPCVDAFVVDPEAPLARAVATVIRNAGGAPDDAALEADAADVPRALQEELAQVVLAAEEAHAAWTTLAASLRPQDLAELGKVHGILLPTVTGAANAKDPAVAKMLASFDVAALVRSAAALALRIERADLARFRGLAGFSFEQDTPLGRIVVRDAGDHVHADGPHVLLLVDTGGNDTYRYPAGAVDAWHTGDEAHHVGLAVDLGGDDTYGYDAVPHAQDGARLPSDRYGRSTPRAPDTGNGPISLSETPRQGAARLGIGMLFDLGPGRDRYRSLLQSQGYGEAGVGVLYDEGGDDVYEGEAAVQGAAHFGVGLLLDGGGDDSYRAYSQAQGFAASRSVGILVDDGGSDTYVADNGDPADGGDPLYWTIQIPGKGNNSFAQGAAWGLRGSSGWPNMAGGLGILRDRRGDDRYEASVQAQASAYWYGTGILADGEGDDTYDGRYYVQGAGAHFGLSVFLEDGGDDRYDMKLTPRATSIGVGHDRSVAWHVDLGGNDEYRAPGLSLGSGNANGTSFLVNVGGDDVYHCATDLSLGAATLSREWYDAFGARTASVATTGIFLDVGGSDVYDGPFTPAKTNGSTWSSKRSPPEWNALEQSAGVDADGGEVSLP